MDQNNKWRDIVKYSLLIGTLLILLVFLLLRWDLWRAAIGKFLTVLKPVFIGVAIAFLLNRPMNRMERLLGRNRFLGDRHKNIRRGLSITLVYLLVFLSLVLLVYYVVPDVAANVATVMEELPRYVEDFKAMLTNLLERFHVSSQEIAGISLSWESILQAVMSSLGTAANSIIGVGIMVTTFTFDFFLGVVISIYLLFSKEMFIRQFRKLVFCLLPTGLWRDATQTLRESNRVFTAYISVKILTSIGLGFAQYIAFLVFQFPYALLFAVIMTVTNIIPYFGPVIGTVLCGLLLLTVNPSLIITLVIISVVAQQLESNLITPRIMGTKVGLPAFWILVVILLGGGMFGLLGMVLSVPVGAILYNLCSVLINQRIKTKSQREAARSGHTPDDPIVPPRTATNDDSTD